MRQDVFQQKMDQILEKCRANIETADDVIGENEAEHDTNLHNLMRATKDNGLMFNSSKCNVKTEVCKVLRRSICHQWCASRSKESKGHQISETHSQ